MRKRHRELIWITRRLTSLDICALTMFQNFNYSNYNTEFENKIMVLNEKITLWIKYLNWSEHEMMVLITSAFGEGSDEPACTHDLARAFASRINKVCKLKKTPNTS